MANQKITQLNSINWSSVDANNDVIPIVDVNDTSMAPSGTTKKISAAQLISSLVPTSRTITINGTTQDLSANRTWTISTGLTVGTTPVTSGTDGRLFFQSGGVVQQDAALFWDNTNKRLGIGATPDTSTRLDVRAQGALSTDIAFRIRNSANTYNIFQINGDSKGIFQIAGNSAPTNNSFHVMGDNQSTIIEVGGWDTGGSRKRGFIARSSNNAVSSGLFVDYGNLSGAGSSSAHLEYSGNAKMNFANYNGNGWAFMRSTAATLSNANTCFAIYSTNTQAGGGTLALGTTLGTTITSLPATTYGKNTFFIANGTAPTTTGTDAFGIYAADIVAGNAAPHFRTESGDVIKLYKETTAIAAVTYASVGGSAVSSNDTFGGYSIGQIVAALKAQGLLA